MTDPKRLEEAQGVDKILLAARAVSTQLGMNPAEQRPVNTFQKFARYQGEHLLGEGINEGSGLCVMQRLPCAANGLAILILDEVQDMPTEDDVVLIATGKCVAHADAVEESQQGAPAGMLDCCTVVAMDVAGRRLLLETIGARAPSDDRSRRHFKKQSFQTPDGLESPRRPQWLILRR